MRIILKSQPNLKKYTITLATDISGRDGNEGLGLPGSGGELAGAGAGVAAGEGGDAVEVAGGAHGAPFLVVVVADVGADGHLVAVAVARPALAGGGAVGALAAGVVDRRLHLLVGRAGLAHAERRICTKEPPGQFKSGEALAFLVLQLRTNKWGNEGKKKKILPATRQGGGGVLAI